MSTVEGRSNRISNRIEIKDNDDEDTFCEACQYGKQHRLPFNNTRKRNSLSEEFIHSDWSVDQCPKIQ